MSDLTIFTPAPAEAAPTLDRVTYDTPIPRPANDSQMAEIVAAAQFLSDADSRLPETAETAREIFDLLGPGNPFTLSTERGEGNWAPNADTGRDPATGRFTAQVPHRALHQERERRKVAEARAAELEVATARAQERLNVLSELVAASGATAQPQNRAAGQQHAEWVDPDVDVFGAVKHLKQQIDQRDAKDAERQYLENYKSDIHKFMKQTPDFFQAHQSLVQSRDAELLEIGWTNPAERRQQIAREERQLTQNAIAAGHSPASIVYNLAKNRGYGRQAAPPQQQYNPEAVAQIERMQGNRQASASLSGAGGSGGGGLSVSDIANMSEHEFERLIGKLGGLSDPRVKQAFGG